MKTLLVLMAMVIGSSAMAVEAGPACGALASVDLSDNSQKKIQLLKPADKKPATPDTKDGTY